MSCLLNTTVRLRSNLERIGLNLTCAVDEFDLDPDPEMSYYLCKLTGNHAYLPNQALRDWHHVLLIYISTVVILAGIILNALSIAVLSRERRYSSAVFLLQVLAVADIVFLILNLLNFTVPVLILANKGLECEIDPFLALMVNAYKSNIHFGRLIAQTLQSCRILAVGMMLIVSVDRYIAIFYPLQAKHLCTFKAARKMIAALTMYALLWLGIFITLSHVKVSRNVRNKAFAVSTIVNLIIPASVVFILTSRLIKSLHDSRKIHRSMSRGQGSERRASYRNQTSEYFALTSKLVSIASLFLVCVLPSIIVAINYILVVEWKRDCCLSSRSLSIINMVAILMMNVSSAANFFMYIFTGWRFRRALYDMLFSRCCPRPINENGIGANGVTRSTYTSTQL